MPPVAKATGGALYTFSRMLWYTTCMTRTTIGVLRGGPSPEYDVSLQTGAALMQALPEERYDVRDLLIDRRGQWHERGRSVEPVRALQRCDVVLNGLHGTYGEDGEVQRILERIGVPFTGARAEAAGLTMHKARTRDAVRQHVAIPQALVFTLDQDLTTGQMAQDVYLRFAAPYIVKPLQGGSSIGVRIVQTLHELPDAIGDVLDEYDAVIVEEYVLGTEATVTVLQDFRETPLYALPPVEIHTKNAFLDYEAKYGGSFEGVCPGCFAQDIKERLMDAARSAHKATGLRHYSRSDFIVHPSGRVYFLEVNALPSLASDSPVLTALEAVGSSLPELVEHLITLARERTEY